MTSNVITFGLGQTTISQLVNHSVIYYFLKHDFFKATIMKRNHCTEYIYIYIYMCVCDCSYSVKENSFINGVC